MVESDGNPQPTILHVCSADSPADRLRDLLAPTAIDVAIERRPDVYRALASICRHTSTHRAVVVCMDQVGPPELEFFALAARYRKDLPILVYGSARSNPRLSKAIQLGAAGEANAATISDIVGQWSCAQEEARDRDQAIERSSIPPQRVDDEPSPVVSGSPPDLRPSSGESVGDSAERISETNASEWEEPQVNDRGEDPGGGEDNDSGDAGEEPSAAIDTNQAVRVPWLQYKDAPARTRPDEREESDSAAAGPCQDPNVHQPLLTAEELQALIGDDLASSVQKEANDGLNPAPDGGVEP